MPAPKTTAPDPLAALSEEERELYLSLRARVTAAETDTLEARELTARERVLSAVMAESSGRAHLEGCPAIDDRTRAAARTEAYTEVRPAQPARGLGPKPLVVVRCIECGGSRYFDGEKGRQHYATADELVLAELERRTIAEADSGLDVTL